MPDTSTQELLADGFDAEDIALVVDAENQAQGALAAMYQAKRTLKEARQKQHLVKQSRKYTTCTPPPQRAPQAREGEPEMTPTLTVSVVGSAAIEQPTAPTSRWQPKPKLGKVPEKIQQAPFVCYTGEAETEVPGVHRVRPRLGAHIQWGGLWGMQLTTQDVVWRGMAVIDGGATQTIGSVAGGEACWSRTGGSMGGAAWWEYRHRTHRPSPSATPQRTAV